MTEVIKATKRKAISNEKMLSRKRGHFFMAYIRGEAREQVTMFPVATVPSVSTRDYTDNPVVGVIACGC